MTLQKCFVYRERYEEGFNRNPQLLFLSKLLKQESDYIHTLIHISMENK